jgi:hypothetical protein
MTRVDEFRNDGRSDKTRSSRKKYPHAVFSFRSFSVVCSNTLCAKTELVSASVD